MQQVQQFKNAEKVKKMSKVIESEKKLREEYDELAAEWEVMEQQLEEAYREQIDILISKNQALQILYLKHHINEYKTS